MDEITEYEISLKQTLSFDYNKLVNKMHDLEKVINYKFNNINYLIKAMDRTKVKYTKDGINHKEYENDAYATLGDSLLNFVTLTTLYNGDANIRRKGSLTIVNEFYVNNDTMKRVIDYYHINLYCFNNLTINDKYLADHEKVAIDPQHPTFIESIIAAVYYDSDFETAKEFIQEFYLKKVYEIYMK